MGSRLWQNTDWLLSNSDFSPNDTKLTRKSSCINARGIPTAVYQVLHVLSCPGGGGTLQGVPGWGIPILTLYPSWGTPLAGPGLVAPPPSRLDLARYPPPLDRHVSKHNLPSYYVCSRLKCMSCYR